ncbi:RHS repeat-associated core domain-containing protein [Shewanella sp. 8A]|uniref:RHS repeat domain-containing protein n=1 Tax=Shewanella sp. 8A TaxID=2943323 RepID=UPI0032DEC260
MFSHGVRYEASPSCSRVNGSNDTFYLHKDHQGSVIATTNASGTVVSQAIYDPWGKRSTVYLESLLANFTYSEPTDRGYTGHKHIKDLDIIHMSERIYDPTLGRFLQADPNIQAPLDSQSYNRYAYVRNNPMSMTDPRGYFFDSLTKLAGFLGGGIEGAALSHHTHRFIANSQTLTSLTVAAVGIVTTAFCGPCSIGFTALATSNLTYTTSQLKKNCKMN